MDKGIWSKWFCRLYIPRYRICFCIFEYIPFPFIIPLIRRLWKENHWQLPHALVYNWRSEFQNQSRLIILQIWINISMYKESTFQLMKISICIKKIQWHTKINKRNSVSTTTPIYIPASLKSKPNQKVDRQYVIYESKNIKDNTTEDIQEIVSSNSF